MKKIVSILLVLVTVLSMGTMAFADGTTTLTTTVPPATYTLNIPADQVVPFGTTEMDIGVASVSNSGGFASGKNLKVTVEYTPFVSDAVSTVIPYTLTLKDSQYNRDQKELTTGDYFTFLGLSSGKLTTHAYLGHYYSAGSSPVVDTDLYAEKCILTATSADWGKALGGDYTAKITFTSEVVVG